MRRRGREKEVQREGQERVCRERSMAASGEEGEGVEEVYRWKSLEGRESGGSSRRRQ